MVDVKLTKIFFTPFIGCFLACYIAVSLQIETSHATGKLLKTGNEQQQQQKDWK